ncbi:protein FAM185A isoform X1 [Anas acuta]|uniref:Family with sequence similarity 185 member A n=2 Tax=Anas platyrhynchos TaxID=8839 RepID=A0A493TSA0_ANAPP|nr:protein FAM185A isoform X1 [Anas platyrhynchos]
MRALRAGCRWWPRAWSSSSAAPGGSRKPLKEWELAVGPRGRLRVRLPCEVSVRPLEPRRSPGSERRLLVTVRGDRRDPERVRVRYDEELQLAAIAADGVGSGAAVEVRAPAQFDLDIKTSGTGCVKIQKIECSNCKIETEKGTSVLQSIKSHKIDIRTKGGKVIGLGTLCGNTDIHATEKGSVNIEKLQGSSINITTEDGLLKTKYLYAESSSLSSVTGDILLGSIHGNTSLQTKTGSITVDSSDGSLKASTHQGSIDVYVSQLREVDLKSQKGSITVKVPASLKAYLELSGRKVDVSSEIQLKDTQSASKDDHVTLSGHMNQSNEADKWIKADTESGEVRLKSQSWIQSVKLKIS